MVRLNRAVAAAEARGPLAGLALLDGLDTQLPRSHQLPSVRAELLLRLGDTGAARGRGSTARWNSSAPTPSAATSNAAAEPRRTVRTADAYLHL